jgi:membrane fusion protein (multidrug efflux system)
MRTSLLVILVSLMSLTACYKKPAPASGPVAVNIQLVKSRPVFYFDRYPANITALSQVDLRPQVQGYITGLSFTEGEHVQKGQALYEIDRRLYQESYDQAKANLEVALGNLKQAQQDADRYTYLNNYDAVAKQILDHAAITLQNAKNTVNAAEQTLKMAETNLNYSIITAPFEGTIGFSQVKLGNMVTVGQTVLNTVSTDDPMGVDFLISEKQLDFFNDLKRGRLHPVDSLFTIILPNDSVYPSTGKISVIDRAVDPQSGTIRVRVVFPNPDHTLRPGTSCILRVHNQETGSKLVIPGRALVELMGEYFVYVVKDTVAPDPADSTKKQPVQMALQKKSPAGPNNRAERHRPERSA